MSYIGRFAPTPSGPLHLGSLLAALASFLDARHAKGRWLVRIEDIDPPRCPTGTTETILRQLDAFGLTWDASVRYQSTCHARYQAALEQLAEQGLAYPCSCSRKEWREHAIYPGWCRHGPLHPERSLAWRLRSDLGLRPVEWEDRRLGHQRFDPAELGDVVLKRKDDLWAYQLAVVVDDADQGVSDVVRGADLLDNTPWQRQLQDALGFPVPRYLHLPLVLGDNGQKLSKQNLAPALPTDEAGIRHTLHHALQRLGQQPPREMAHACVADQLDAAINAWRPERLRDMATNEH
ncbi:tRNA glutamyl-Q(34) synthetase GluQRS [Chromohalobacter canadensis]|uniref:tRNA glutamyl-Q(34) synthetase GluQRS n=1 Tax=Chromohalobacter canadensis TaxID=141389 RepID=UPI0021BFEE98|nr:tRNA glutamyl-Q(34) synthetase GluQRS [Chromohalobacter canadensis]MCT8469288.1 tRNA glutamyl-Q(34) synthetase GluQRS [Chromohalobacter canadensis]MCT8472522.1 tRNA glutamyl-Q(34) synthetase GluQRS [Chromohalobacter canadensis]MCT8499975.1 tRNA glutamyl-Q(34) synthetase GluQRS [Chromohalobacter canadensis]